MALLALATDKFYPDVNPPNVIVPFANAVTQPGTLAVVKMNLTCQGLYPRFVDLTTKLDQEFAYWRLLRELWEEGKPFILVEHDILPWPGALKGMWECPEPWCAHRYTVLGSYCAYLGCTKFDPARLGACPLPDEPTEWQKLDMLIVRELAKREHRGHVHDPPVCHLNYGHQMMTRSIRTMV